MAESTHAAPRVDSTLSKGLRILEVLAGSPEGRGVTELARELGLTKSNTFRLLRSLTALGYVRLSEHKAYSATLKVWQVGQQVLDNLDIAGAAESQMRLLARETAEAVYLAVPDGVSIVYVDKIDSSQPIRSFTPKGGSAPMHCVGTGKALLADDYGRLRDRIRGHLTRHTDRTITTLRRLDADVARTLERGFAVDEGEYRDRINSYGAAIRLPGGPAVAAIGVSVPDVNLPEGRAESIAELVRDAAQAVSAGLADV